MERLRVGVGRDREVEPGRDRPEKNRDGEPNQLERERHRASDGEMATGNSETEASGERQRWTERKTETR